MSRHSLARLLAPLALLAVGAALFMVLSGGSDTGSSGSAAPESGRTAKGASGSKAAKARRKRRSARPRTYTVKPGDTPSGIADRAGITVEKLLDLNPEVDPQSLAAGARLRLR